MNESLVIIPTYNEKENVEKMLRKIFSLPHGFDVLIIDDGSPDGTSAIVKGLMKEFDSRLFLEERSGKLGLGTAYIHGFKWAIKNKYNYIFEMAVIFLTILTTSFDYIMPAQQKVLICLLAQDIFVAQTS